MRRIHFYESVDLDICPQALRDGVTDWVQFMYNTHKAFDALAPKLRRAMDAVGTTRVIDLASGGGGPWITLERALAKSGDVKVTLTDLRPNLKGMRNLAERSEGRVGFFEGSVDATNVPSELRGVRTLMNAFHHFPPDLARGILADAVRTRQPIVIFEGTDSRFFGILLMLTMPLMMILLMPFVRPLRWSRLFLTYVIPLLPLVSLLDGTVSMLRTYLPHQLRELIESIPGHESFDWEIGTQPIPRSPIGMTFLVGTPR